MNSRERWFFLIVVALSLYVLMPLWMPLAAGLVLAYLSEGPTFKLYDRWNVRAEWLKLTIAVGFVVLVSMVFIAPLTLLTWSASVEVLNLYNEMSAGHSAMETGNRLLTWVDQLITPWIQSTGLNVSFSDYTTRLQQSIEPFLKNTALYFANILSGTPAVLLFVGVTVMAWVYFLVHGREQRRILLPKLLPWPEERDLIGNTMGEVLRALVLTSIVLSVIQSLLVALTLGITGVPKFYLWAALSFFLSFIPVFGTAPVMLGGAIYCFTNDKPGAGVVIIVMAIFIGSIDNIIRPLLMKGSTELNFFWLFMALVGGIAIFGLAGAVIGPWAFAMFSEIVKRGQSNDSPRLN
ncbi:MAG: AI-2E family transporter [Bdellovibrionota bacterium]|nr:MAG: AI-2E family transporter [Pseudomonadota bacterium]